MPDPRAPPGSRAILPTKPLRPPFSRFPPPPVPGLPSGLAPGNAVGAARLQCRHMRAHQARSSARGACEPTLRRRSGRRSGRRWGALAAPLRARCVPLVVGWGRLGRSLAAPGHTSASGANGAMRWAPPCGEASLRARGLLGRRSTGGLPTHALGRRAASCPSATLEMASARAASRRSAPERRRNHTPTMPERIPSASRATRAAPARLPLKRHFGRRECAAPAPASEKEECPKSTPSCNPPLRADGRGIWPNGPVVHHHLRRRGGQWAGGDEWRAADWSMGGRRSANEHRRGNRELATAGRRGGEAWRRVGGRSPQAMGTSPPWGSRGPACKPFLAAHG